MILYVPTFNYIHRFWSMIKNPSLCVSNTSRSYVQNAALRCFQFVLLQNSLALLVFPNRSNSHPTVNATCLQTKPPNELLYRQNSKLRRWRRCFSFSVSNEDILQQWFWDGFCCVRKDDKLFFFNLLFTVWGLFEFTFIPSSTGLIHVQTAQWL